MVVIKRRCRLFVIFCSIHIVLIGCEKKLEDNSRIIAKIDDFEITFGDFKEQFKKLNPGKSITKAGKDLKQNVLNDMIEQQLILFEAYRLGYDRDEKVMQFVESREKVLAGEVLRKREVDDKVINEEAIAKFYLWLDKEVKLLRMKFVFDPDDNGNKEKTEKTVKQIYSNLQAGADFKTLAAEFSQHKTAKKDSGDMRTVGCYDIYEELFEQAYNLSEGESSRPFVVNNTFYILKVEKIYPKVRGTLDEEKAQIISMLKEYYKTQLTNQFSIFKKGIMEEYEHALNLENIKFFCNHAGKIKSKADSAGLFNQQEKTKILASTSIEQTTIGEFFNLAFHHYWESLDQERLVKMMLSERNFRRLVNHKAIQLKLNKVPEVEEELNKWRIYYYKKFVLQQEVEDKIDVSDGVLIPIYEQQRNKLIFEEQRTVREIFCKTREDINKVYTLANEGYDFKGLEKKYQQYRGTRTNGIIGPFRKGPHGKLGENAFNMNINEISEPFRYRGGYSIVQLLSIEPKREKTYQEAKEELKEQYVSENKKAFISQWLNNISKNYKINRYEL